jgi:hypothetical protein
MPTEAELHGAPRPTQEDLQELHDVSRDIQGIAAGQSGAERDLADDLERFASDRKTGNVDGLSRAMAAALKGKTIDQAASRRLALQLYVAVNADKMTAEQRTQASNQLQQTLSSAGVARAQADAVVSQMPQAAATAR